MPANDGMPRACSRRSLLAALVAGLVTVGSATTLAGCGVQLEEDAPRIPLIPTRVPVTDEQALLVVLARSTALRSLAKSAERGATSIAGQLSTLHATQVDVISRLLRDGGVPESRINGATAHAPAASASPAAASPTKAALGSAEALAAAEAKSVSDFSLAKISKSHVALIGALFAQRLAAETLLGGTAASERATGPKGAEALRLLTAARAAVYGFEVVAAQIDSNGSALALTSLTSLRTRASELELLVGSSRTPPPLGYQLPFPVTDTKSARALAIHLLDGLLSGQAAALESATGDADALTTLVQWLGATEAMASRWGAPLAAFPGMKNG